MNISETEKREVKVIICMKYYTILIYILNWNFLSITKM